MAKRKPLTNREGHVRGLEKEDFRKTRSLDELPPTLRHKLSGRGPQKAPTKERITIRLSREVVEQFRASGHGWQTRIDTALKEWLETHQP